VRSGQRDLVYLLPELCFVTGLTTDMKSDRRMTTNIQALTRVAPHDRVKKINDFSQEINS
jgi:aubergine-like protein